MSYNAVPTVAPGDAWSAAQHNTYIRDNFAAMWKGVSAGDLDYYTGAIDKMRLALVAGGILTGGASAPAYLPLVTGGLLYGGASAPAYLPLPPVPAFLYGTPSLGPVWYAANAMPGSLHAKATVDRASSVSIPGNSTYKDITGCSVTLVTSVACTIVLRAMATMNCVTAGNTTILRATIGAVNDSGALPETSSANSVPVGYEWYLASQPAGSYVCKLAAWANGAGGSVTNARLAVYAMVE